MNAFRHTSLKVVLDNEHIGYLYRKGFFFFFGRIYVIWSHLG